MMRLFALVLCVLASSAASGAEPMTLKAIGVIEAYDATTHTLVLTTSIEVKRFTLDPSVRIQHGRHVLDASRLAELIGYHASVRYLDREDRQTVESVHVWQRRGDRETGPH
jgi:hypothetical protein